MIGDQINSDKTRKKSDENENINTVIILPVIREHVLNGFRSKLSCLSLLNVKSDFRKHKFDAKERLSYLPLRHPTPPLETLPLVC